MRNKFEKVFDGRNRRLRGLWKRNHVFYAQLRLDGQAKARRVPLHDVEGKPVSTVPQAVAAMASIKTKRAQGSLEIQPTRGGLSLAEAAKVYLEDAEKLKFISDSTIVCYRKATRCLTAFNGSIPINKIDAAFATNYATWRSTKR